MIGDARSRASRLRLALGDEGREARDSVLGGGFVVHRAEISPRRRRGTVDLDPALLPRGAVWLDTETTGLSGGTGTVVFLIGLVVRSPDGLSLEQYVLHRLGAERAMLESVVGRLRFATALVTYNGRRFDWPLLETRLRLQRLAAPWDEPPHLDLLPTGRRLWRGLLGTARLAAIESDILGVCRERDIPGSEIPARYVSFLRTGRAEMLDVIVDHNREDLLTLLAVHAVEARIAAGEAPPVDVDLAGYGRHLERLERWEEALAAYCGAIEGIHERRARQLAAVRAGTLLRRLGRHEESLAIWLSAAERGILPPSDALQRAAVVADRWLRDPGLALDLVDRALRHLDRRALLGVQPAAVDRDPRGRLDSMRRRLASRVRAPGNGTQVAFSPGR